MWCSIHPDQPYAYKEIVSYTEPRYKRTSSPEFWFFLVVFFYYDTGKVTQDRIHRKYALMCDGREVLVDEWVQEDAVINVPELKIKRSVWMDEGEAHMDYFNGIRPNDVSVGVRVPIGGTSPGLFIGVGDYSTDIIPENKDILSKPVKPDSEVDTGKDLNKPRSPNQEVEQGNAIVRGAETELVPQSLSHLDTSGPVWTEMLYAHIGESTTGGLEADIAWDDATVPLRVGEEIPLHKIPQEFLSRNGGFEDDLVYRIESWSVYKGSGPNPQPLDISELEPIGMFGRVKITIRGYKE